MITKVERIQGPTVEERPVEIVERKGLGHPDTICDGIAEEIARRLTKYYYESSGVPLHFNLDKAVLVGGRSAPRFGGGTIVEPIEIYIAGRATLQLSPKGEGELVPIGPIILSSVKDYLKRNFRYLDPNEHVIVNYRIRPGSPELVENYVRGLREGVPTANDTSIGVGFAPLSTTEKICLAIERELNSASVKKKYPFIGEDVKVMCIRTNNRINATLAVAIIDREVSSLEEYIDAKRRIEEIATKSARRFLGEHDISVEVNVADVIKEKPEKSSIYLTVTGTSAEAGDDGQIGRGNRANGLITPMRPMSIEAPGGKNAVSHVGKIYQIAAQRVADRIVREIQEVREVYVYLVSKIGAPITSPQLAYIEYSGEGSVPQSDIEGILEEVLEQLPMLWREFMEGRITTY